MAEIEFTPAQQQAIQDRDGAVLVSAAAGSGKTKVLVERLLSRVCDAQDPCDIDRFLIITFTKKAAAELRGRIAGALSERLAQEPENRHLQRQLQRVYLAQISTVHAFCGELVREFAYALDVPADFRLAEGGEANMLWQRALQQLLEEKYRTMGDDPAFKALVDSLGAGRDDRRIPALLERVYDGAQCHLYPDQWLTQCLHMLDMGQYSQAEQTPWGAYLCQRLRQTLSDSIAAMKNAVARMACCPDLAEKYGPVFRENIRCMEALQAEKTWDGIYARRDISFGRLNPVRKCTDPELKELVCGVRKQCAEEIKKQLESIYAPSTEVLADLAQTAQPLQGLFLLAQDMTRQYGQMKLRQHVLEFSDLEHLSVKLLVDSKGEPTAVARELSQRFVEIMVDEYQDTNEVQDALFTALSRKGQNRFMVGDVKQSIYRFRLADPTIFLEKYMAYPVAGEAKPGQPRKILLSHNFRSGKEILEAANAVFGQCMSVRVGGLDYTSQEALAEGTSHEALPDIPVELHCIALEGEEEKDAAEAEFVARRIGQLLEEKTLVREKDRLRPIEPQDIAILLRSVKPVAQQYIQALCRRGIPCHCDAGGSILDTEEVETLLSLLQVLDNGHQDIPLTGALLSPLFGLPAQALAKARGEHPQGDLYDALWASKDPQIAQMVALLNDLRQAAAQLPLHRLLEEIHARTGLEQIYSAMPGGETRLANLRQFAAEAAAYADGGRRSLHQFLTYIDGIKEQGLPAAESGSGRAVTILSIHKAKGLEFPVVILAGLSRRFNQEDIRSSVLLHPELGVGCNAYDSDYRCYYPTIAKKAIGAKQQEENLSEELRVLYVAMTRPKDRLIMTYCSKRLAPTVRNLARNLTMLPKQAVAARADCPGYWVLATALGRTEAGALFDLGAKPENTEVSACPWRICLHQAKDGFTQESPPAAEPETAAAPPLDWEDYLSCVTDHPLGEAVPTKVTATQLKGRSLDEELEQPPSPPSAIRLVRPSLLQEDRPLSPAEKGTAMHLAMQYIDFAQTGDLLQISAQLERLVRQEFITAKQAAAIDPVKLLRVFQGPVGQQIRQAEKVVREFKFSLLTDAEVFFPQAAGEKIMLQGVTDCCLFYPQGLTVIDFKTDWVRPGEEMAAAENYRGQLGAYGIALSRIFGRPVKKKLLYFFHTDCPVELP